MNSAIIVVSLILCCFVAEIALRVVFSETALHDPGDDDEFWKALMRSAIAEERTLFARDIQLDPNLGWRMTPNWQSDGVEHNSVGYRAAREFSLVPNGPRAMFIGDSYTYGLGVTNDETYAARFEDATGIEAINAGVNGFGIDQTLLLWRSEGIAYAPSLVVLGYFVGDFNRNVLTFRDGPKPWFYPNSEAPGGFVLEGTPVPPIETLVSEGFFDSGSSLRLIDLVRYAQRRIYFGLGLYETELNQRKVQVSDFLLRELRDSAAAAGIRLLVLLIGNCVDGASEFLWIEEQISRSCVANEIDCINLAAEMRAAGYDSFYGSNCHWSPRGHQFAADRVAAFVEAL